MVELPAELRGAVARGGDDLRVLVLRFGALGDVLRTLPAVRLIRGGLPRAVITWAVDESWAGFLEGHPDIDSVHAFPRSRWNRLRSTPVAWRGLPALIGEWRGRLRAADADLVLDFHGNLRSGVSGWLSGAAVRLGYAGHQQKEGNRWLTTHRVPAGPRRISRVERNLALVRALGLPDAPLPSGGLALPETRRARAAEAVVTALGSAGPYAVVVPGVSRKQAYKRPPAALLAAAIGAAHARGVRSIVVWGPDEQDDARAVVKRAGPASALAPPTDLPALTALLADARLAISGDTGPLHLACAVDCPVVALYGPTDPVVNAPWRVPHESIWPAPNRYTGIKRRDRRQGFEGLDERSVARATERLLERLASTSADGAGPGPDAPAAPSAG